MSGTDVRYAATRCCLRRESERLRRRVRTLGATDYRPRARYDMSGTDVACPATRKLSLGEEDVLERVESDDGPGSLR
eukprot:409184-Rhodomonas_salina.2